MSVSWLGYYTIVLHSATIGEKWGMYTDSPQLMVIWYRFFGTLQWYKSNTHSVETILGILIFSPDLWYAAYDIIIYCLAILGSGNSRRITRVNNWSTYNHSVPRQPSVFHFQHSPQYIAWAYSTLYYKIGIMLDDSPTAGLYKCSEHGLRQAKLSYGVQWVQCTEFIFDLSSFQLFRTFNLIRVQSIVKENE